HLERDPALEVGIKRGVDDAHRTGADLALEPVAPQRRGADRPHPRYRSQEIEVVIRYRHWSPQRFQTHTPSPTRPALDRIELPLPVALRVPLSNRATAARDGGSRRRLASAFADSRLRDLAE